MLAGRGGGATHHSLMSYQERLAAYLGALALRPDLPPGPEPRSNPAQFFALSRGPHPDRVYETPRHRELAQHVGRAAGEVAAAAAASLGSAAARRVAAYWAGGRGTGAAAAGQSTFGPGSGSRAGGALAAAGSVVDRALAAYRAGGEEAASACPGSHPVADSVSGANHPGQPAPGASGGRAGGEGPSSGLGPAVGAVLWDVVRQQVLGEPSHGAPPGPDAGAERPRTRQRRTRSDRARASADEL